MRAARTLSQPGDTMWNISQRYGVSVEQVMAANGGTTNIRIGQNLVIPGAGGAAPAPAQPHGAAREPRSGACRDAGRRRGRRRRLPPAPAVAPAAEILPAGAAQAAVAAGDARRRSAPPRAAPAGNRRAPASAGRCAAGSSPASASKPDGERNDGINLAVPEGTAVKAAEDGTVIYAGNELKSYGNLVLIRHADGWVSAYAHNSELKVNRGDTVQRGEIVALSGMSGGGHHAAGAFRAAQGRHAGRPAAASERGVAV